MKKSLISGLFFLTILLLSFTSLSADTPSAAPTPTPTPMPQRIGPKLRVAVLPIETKAGGSGQIGDTIREMIITALINSEMFNVVERGALGAVINEQDLGNSGRVTTESSAKTGKLLGAQVLISGAITEFTNVSSGGGMLLGPLVIGEKSAKLAIDLRIIDSNTGEIISSEKAEGSSSTSVLGGGGMVGSVPVGGAFGQNEPIGKAARDAVEKALNIIIAKTAAIKWAGRIIKRENELVYVNSGNNSGVKLGDSFTVYSKGEDLIDPDTGLALGAQEKEIGRITVTEVKDKYSIARIKQEKSDEGEIKDGDIVR